MPTPRTLGLAAVICIAAATCLAASAASASTIHEIDYAGHDVSLTDSKGVTTELSDFAYWTGPNILVALRGDAKVEIPFRKIRSLEIGKYQADQGSSPATLVTTKGVRYELQLERFEGRRYVSGTADFGTLRIQLMQISKLTIKGFSHTDPDGQ